MTGRRAAGIAMLIAAAALLSFRPVYEPDLWWHLAQGRENAAGRLVRANVFSFAYPEYPQRYTSWLFDTSAYFAWRAGGAYAIQALQASLLALTLWLVYGSCRMRAPAWAAVVVVMVGVFVLEPRAIPRPHLVSFAGVAACALAIERAIARRSAAPLAWTVPGIALWSNLHVECVFGAALVGLFAVSEAARPAALPRAQGRRALAIAAAAVAATLANPYGWGLWGYLFENSSVPSILAIAELQPPPVVPYRAFYVYLAAGAVLFVWRWRSLAPWEAAAFVLFGALGARYLRLTPLVLLATAPIVATRLGVVVPRSPSLPVLAVTIVAACIGLSRLPVHVLATGVAAGPEALAPRAFFSEDAVAFARAQRLEGPVFNSHNLGGYLAWTLYPHAPIFQDSRLQAYPPEHFLAILVASRSQPDWDVLVADVDWAVLSLPRPNQLSGVGRFPPSEWKTVFRDRATEIVVRRSGRYAGLTEMR